MLTKKWIQCCNLPKRTPEHTSPRNVRIQGRQLHSRSVKSALAIATLDSNVRRVSVQCAPFQGMEGYNVSSKGAFNASEMATHQNFVHSRRTYVPAIVVGKLGTLERFVHTRKKGPRIPFEAPISGGLDTRRPPAKLKLRVWASKTRLVLRRTREKAISGMIRKKRGNKLAVGDCGRSIRRTFCC